MSDLKELIRQESPTWLRRSRERTGGFVTAGAFDEASSIWSEVKVVYMRLQGDSKCAYCERKLESEYYGQIEQDVEHFRPKKKVVAWTVPVALDALGIAPAVVPANSGYYRLAYHPFNYCASCKPCNSALKGNYFPIEGAYNFNATSARAAKRERAFLVFPVGSWDEDPEQLIDFYGASPRALRPDGFRRSRALVTIEFLGLDDSIRRKNLYRERARILGALFPQLQIRSGILPADDETCRTAERLITGYTSAKAPHTNCARSYVRLYDSDRAAAERLYHEAAEFGDTTSSGASNRNACVPYSRSVDLQMCEKGCRACSFFRHICCGMASRSK